MASLLDLSSCAHRHLQHYVTPGSGRAFQVYDRQGDAAKLEPVDALAPALLDAPVARGVVVELFGAEDSPYGVLRLAMQDLLDSTLGDEPDFRSLNLDDETGPWMLVRRVLRACDETNGLAASKVTKMLHRKRPHLVPIFDSKVAAFYGATSRRPWLLWPRLQADLRTAGAMADDLRAGVTTPDGRPLSSLRALDIVIWEHQVTNCTG